MAIGTARADYQAKVPCFLPRIASYHVACIIPTQIVLFNEILYKMAAVDLTPTVR